MHIEPSQEAGTAFFANPPKGPIVMLNLLCFRDIADYSAHPDLAPPSPVTGKQAYGLYSMHTLPILQAAGGEVLFHGNSHPFFIGPVGEEWHSVLLVRHRSAEAFRSFATDPEYLKGVGHRTAALADSRLLPISQRA
ncbi:MAG: DUF1330 domain-containing protein [Acidimicrobiia bacterium]